MSSSGNPPFLHTFKSKLKASNIKKTTFYSFRGIEGDLQSNIEDHADYLLSADFFSVGAAALIGPTLVGYMVDFTGNFTAGFCLVSGFFFIGALSLLLVNCLLNRKSKILEINP